MKIMHLNKDLTLKNLNDLLKIDKLIPEDSWTANNFLKDFDHKWDFSYVALEKGDIIGFLICSVKQNNIHVHRIAVSSEHKNKNTGNMLMNNLINECHKSNIKKITLKVKDSNTIAIRFYQNLGFNKMGMEDQRYILEKEI